jgi:hypothetical protein
VVQGAVPIHVYDDVAIKTQNGMTCLTPIGEIANYKLDSAGVSWQIVDVNGNGVNDYGDIYKISINGVSLGDDGFIYLNVHLDYDLEKKSGWVKSSPSTGIDNALDNPNVSGTQPPIMDNQQYTFSADVNGSDLNGSTDTIVNDNIFKNIKGIGGLIKDTNGAGTDDDVFLANVLLKVESTLKGFQTQTTTSDADGWYFFNFAGESGKPYKYTVWADTNNSGQIDVNDQKFIVDLGGNIKYQQMDFFGDWAQTGTGP